MLRLQRPKAPEGFSKAMTSVRRAVKDAIAAGRTLDDLPSPWRTDEHKRSFVSAQRDKCGYCETFVLNHPAAVDHYAPKGEIRMLFTDGVEAGGLNKPRDRQTLAVSATGYHWLAASWANWVLGCERCNTGWKRSIFPLQDDVTSGFTAALEAAYALGGLEAAKAALDANRPPAPDSKRSFTPLLLNPFGPEDPIEHLEFSEHGQIAPRNGSERGRATIRTCGLHRESLRRSREPIAADAFRLVRRLKRALDAAELDKVETAVTDLLFLGAEKRIHAGVVRAIVLSQLALRWPDLEALARRLRPEGSVKRKGRRAP